MPDQNPLSIKDVKKRAQSAFFSLTFRQVIIRFISFVTINLILARVLSVETIGVFNIATSIITFFAFFSDIGLAAALIQKKEAISSEDLKTTFTIQQSLVLVLSILIILTSSFSSKFYGLDNSGKWLIIILGFSFFLSSLKVVPSVMLERELNFGPLVKIEIIETMVFNLILVLLSYRGFGIWSFSAVAITRGIIGTALIYLLAPVRVGIGINKAAAKGLLNYGLPYQINSLLALVKDRLVPLVVAKIVGAVGIGYISWAQSIAFLPLEVLNIIIRITFPAFSRLQHDKKAISEALNKSLFISSIVIFPSIFGLCAVLPSIIAHVVSQKWLPAIPSFYLFSVTAFWAVFSTTFTNALNAIGKIKTTLGLMVFWTILTWILTPALTLAYGFIGVALSSFIISFTSIITIYLIKKVVEVKIIENVYISLLSSSVMFGVVYYSAKIIVRDKLTLGITILLGVVIYTSVLMLLGKKKILENFRIGKE